MTRIGDTSELEKLKEKIVPPLPAETRSHSHSPVLSPPRRQLITEQLPIRRDQLYGKYGVGGDTPLIPDAQSSGVTLGIGAIEAGPSGYVEVLNDNDVAVDVSRWRLDGGGVSFVFLPGTVIPPKDSLFVAAGSVAGFKARRSSPRGGEGRFVVGPLRGTPDGNKGISVTPA